MAKSQKTMEYKNKLTDFAPALTEAEVAAEVARIKELSIRNCRKEVYAFALSAVDLTTLTCNDWVESVSAFAKRAVGLDLLAVQGTLKSLLQHHSSKASILWRSAFFTVQLSHPYTTTGKTIALTRQCRRQS